eukprot:3737509-Rhodomonas_salina.1
MGYCFWHMPLAANAAVNPLPTRWACATIAYWAEYQLLPVPLPKAVSNACPIRWWTREGFLCAPLCLNGDQLQPETTCVGPGSGTLKHHAEDVFARRPKMMNTSFIK